jgi:mono/diheme cytochrome c family protein
MPSYEYRGIGPEDLGALISWIKSMPSVDTEPRDQEVGPLGRVLFFAGLLPLVPAEMIDYSDMSFRQPEAGSTVEYGAYLATTCLGCHGEGFSGGPIPGVPPDWPEAGNLTPDADTEIGAWSEQEFRSFFENGTKPDGTVVDASYMPWPIGQQFTDEEMDALWLFLRSLPATTQGNR